MYSEYQVDVLRSVLFVCMYGIHHVGVPVPVPGPGNTRVCHTAKLTIAY